MNWDEIKKLHELTQLGQEYNFLKDKQYERYRTSLDGNFQLYEKRSLLGNRIKEGVEVPDGQNNLNLPAWELFNTTGEHLKDNIPELENPVRPVIYEVYDDTEALKFENGFVNDGFVKKTEFQFQVQKSAMLYQEFPKDTFICKCKYYAAKDNKRVLLLTSNKEGSPENNKVHKFTYFTIDFLDKKLALAQKKKELATLELELQNNPRPAGGALNSIWILFVLGGILVCFKSLTGSIPLLILGVSLAIFGIIFRSRGKRAKEKFMDLSQKVFNLKNEIIDLENK